MSVELRQAGAQAARRLRQLHSTFHREGLSGVGRRVQAAAADWLSPKQVMFPVRAADVLAADLSHPFQPVPRRTQVDGRTVLNWVTTPPGLGSGGHSTTFRIIKWLEQLGYVNRVYFYDAYGGDHAYYASIVRDAYAFKGLVSSMDDPMEDADAVIATSWPTAYAVFNARCSGKRYYFVQDYEPSFHPVGSWSVLAENTYRMGLHGITAGAWLASKLRSEFGMKADHFEFGCDISKYRRKAEASRRGVAYYARPETPRRGYEIGIMALEVFKQRRPDIQLHLYGESLGRLPFDCVEHGRVTVEQLNEIYNQCYAGLSISLTNVSLVPHEMLAAGCIPVVNDASQNRTVLNNPHVEYAPLTPHALAAALETVVTRPDFDTVSRAAASSVQSALWSDAGARVDSILKYGLAS